jgi:hypothetical protein
MAARTSRVYETQIVDLLFAEVDPPRFDRAISIISCCFDPLSTGEGVEALLLPAKMLTA